MIQRHKDHHGFGWYPRPRRNAKRAFSGEIIASRGVCSTAVWGSIPTEGAKEIRLTLLPSPTPLIQKQPIGEPIPNIGALLLRQHALPFEDDLRVSDLC